MCYLSRYVFVIVTTNKWRNEEMWRREEARRNEGMKNLSLSETFILMIPSSQVHYCLNFHSFFVIKHLLRVDSRERLCAALLLRVDSTLLQSDTQVLEILLILATAISSIESQQSTCVFDVGQETRQVASVAGRDRVCENHRSTKTRHTYRLH